MHRGKLPQLPVSSEEELSEPSGNTTTMLLMVSHMMISGKQFAVSDARRLCRSLLDAINDVVLIFEPNSLRVIAANKSACKAYGYTKKELVGKHLQVLTQDTTDYSHALRSGRNFERTDVNKQGGRLDFLVSLSAVDYWAGERSSASIGISGTGSESRRPLLRA